MITGGTITGFRLASNSKTTVLGIVLQSETEQIKATGRFLHPETTTLVIIRKLLDVLLLGLVVIEHLYNFFK